MTSKTIIIVGAAFSMAFPFLYLGYKYNSKKAASGEDTGCLATIKKSIYDAVGYDNIVVWGAIFTLLLDGADLIFDSMAVHNTP